MSASCAAFVVCLYSLYTPVEGGPVKPPDAGWWNIELGAGAVIDEGRAQREGDAYLTGCIEYERPFHARATLGVRAYPLFLYHEDHQGRAIYGAGAGLALRYYEQPGAMLGWYGEFGSSILWHSSHFNENSSRVNFMSELGVGYRFDASWRAALKYRHISNAGLGDDNTANNAFALTIGYSF